MNSDLTQSKNFQRKVTLKGKIKKSFQIKWKMLGKYGMTVPIDIENHKGIGSFTKEMFRKIRIMYIRYCYCEVP